MMNHSGVVDQSVSYCISRICGVSTGREPAGLAVKTPSAQPRLKQADLSVYIIVLLSLYFYKS